MRSPAVPAMEVPGYGNLNFLRGEQQFEEEMTRNQFSESQDLMTRENLWQVIEDGQLMLQYDPCFDLVGGAQVGAEALLLWRSHQDTWAELSPVKIEIEASGLANELAIWVLSETLKQVACWHQQGAHWGLSLRVSPQQLQSHRYCKFLREALLRHKLRADQLMLVLKASDLRFDSGYRRQLETLLAMGVELAIDELDGAGLDGLGIWAPTISEVRMDWHAAQQLTNHEDYASAVRSMCSGSDAKSPRFAATGVETHADFRRLQANGFDRAQGNYFCPPMGGDALWRHYSSTAGSPRNLNRL